MLMQLQEKDYSPSLTQHQTVSSDIFLSAHNPVCMLTQFFSPPSVGLRFVEHECNGTFRLSFPAVITARPGPVRLIRVI